MNSASLCTQKSTRLPGSRATEGKSQVCVQLLLLGGINVFHNISHHRLKKQTPKKTLHYFSIWGLFARMV